MKQSIANLANQLPQHQLLERAKLYAQQPHEELDGAIEDVLSWFSQSSNEQWLLVYDNVDHEISAEINDPDAFNLREYLPEADQGCILITSRLTNLQHLGGLDFRLGPMSQLQGENILTSSVGEPVRGESNCYHMRQISSNFMLLLDSEKLISLLQGLPLAINQAGAYIRTTGTSVLAYMKLYDEAWGKLMEAQHRYASHGPLDHSVMTTWTLLFRRLEEKNGNAAKLLLLWGFLDNRDIWYELFTPVLDCKITSELPSWYTSCVNDYFNFTECTQLLTLYSFIDTNIGLSSFSVHPVLHQWCYQASEDEMAEMAWLAFVLVASSAPENTIANYTLVQRRLLPHCDRLFSLVRVTTAKAPFHVEKLSLHDACHIIGILYMHQGKFTKAEDMYVRALAGYEKALGPKHTSTLNTVNNLGRLYRDQGKLREAEDMLMRALTGFEKALGPEHFSTLLTLNNLGISYADQGKFTEAKDMFVRALAGHEKALGPEHTSTLRIVNNLGLIYSNQGEWREAEDIFVRALAGYEKDLGPEHTLTLNIVNSLGLLYSDQGKFTEAEDLYVRALAGYEKALGPEHSSTLLTVNNLGVLYRNQGKFTKAEDMYVRALAGHEKALGPEHSSTLLTVNNLGVLYRNQGKLREAEDMFVRALAGFEKALGPEHFSTVNTVYNLGLLYRDQGKLREAEDMFVRALAGFEKALGPEHFSTLTPVYNLGLLYQDQGKFTEGEAMFVRALAGYEKALGPEHSSILDTVNNLGLLYRNQGKLSEAEDMFERTVTGFEKALGPEHEKTVNARRIIANLKNHPKSKTGRIISKLFKHDKT